MAASLWGLGDICPAWEPLGLGHGSVLLESPQLGDVEHLLEVSSGWGHGWLQGTHQCPSRGHGGGHSGDTSVAIQGTKQCPGTRYPGDTPMSIQGTWWCLSRDHHPWDTLTSIQGTQRCPASGHTNVHLGDMVVAIQGTWWCPTIAGHMSPVSSQSLTPLSATYTKVTLGTPPRVQLSTHPPTQFFWGGGGRHRNLISLPT